MHPVLNAQRTFMQEDKPKLRNSSVVSLAELFLTSTITKVAEMARISVYDVIFNKVVLFEKSHPTTMKPKSLQTSAGLSGVGRQPSASCKRLVEVAKEPTTAPSRKTNTPLQTQSHIPREKICSCKF